MTPNCLWGILKYGSDNPLESADIKSLASTAVNENLIYELDILIYNDFLIILNY